MVLLKLLLHLLLELKALDVGGRVGLARDLLRVLRVVVSVAAQGLLVTVADHNVGGAVGFLADQLDTRLDFTL